MIDLISKIGQPPRKRDGNYDPFEFSKWLDRISKLFLSMAFRLIPAGGASGTFLVKTSANDYDVGWGTTGAFPDAAQVSYGNTTYPNVDAALDHLLYQAPAITSFTLSVGTVEIGSTVSAVTASWTFNKAMASATLTDTTTTGATPNSHVFSGLSLVSNKTYTLTCTDGTNSATSSNTVAFSHKRYWGVSSNTILTSAQIIALTSEFSSSKAKAIAYDCTGGKYPYFCYPASLGAPAGVTVGGLAFSDYTVTAQNFTNASGDTTNFNVVRFNNLQNGADISVNWA